VAVLFSAVQLLCWPSPAVKLWSEQIADKILAFKTSYTSRRQPFSETIAIVDLNDSSLKALESYHPGRAYYAKAIRNLADMGVSLQMVDIVFAGHKKEGADRELVAAVEYAGNVIFGMVFSLESSNSFQKDPYGDNDIKVYLGRDLWRDVRIGKAPDLYYGTDPVFSFAELANASKGMGYLTLTPDRDGVFRRLPLLVRYKDAVYPSFSLKAACDFLKVPPENVLIGKNSITLIKASRPDGANPHDIKIPVDHNGAMRINFVGPWGRMKHYNFSDIYFASKDKNDWHMWQQEMKGKIALVSNTYTGSTDIGIIPVDKAYPLSGVHANVVHTIINENFLRDIRGYQILLLELFFAALLFRVYLTGTAIKLSVVASTLGAVYFSTAVIILILFNVLIPTIKPLLLVFFIWAGLFTMKSIQNAYERLRIQKDKEIAERELEIGRKIQNSFLPSELPSLEGWQIETFFKPAYQVSGDFYDVFELPGGRYHSVVIGDVCDHGVGSALFMAVLRSMVRIFSLQSLNALEKMSPEQLILEAVHKTNNYIAEYHGETSMFATMFIGVLDANSDEMFYVNCGHEPPPLIRHGEVKQFLRPSGLPIGTMQNTTYSCKKITFQKGDYLFLYTDGLIDAVDGGGKSFSKKRLLEYISKNHSDLKQILKRLEDSFFKHVRDGEIIDDVTYLALKKEGD
jgi:serine phosphatase RsbU (regulator of sigma subunit)/CHASE2 domain-containing sensor protein